MAKFLLIMKWSRPDLEKAVSLLTTRLSKRGVDDWKILEGYSGLSNVPSNKKVILTSF